MTSETVYLDHAASCPVDPTVLAAMQPWLCERFGNAASRHAPGRAAAQAVEQAREQVATLLGCSAASITFCSGGTESCNLAIKGLVRPHLRRGSRVHIVASLIEHPAVLDPLRRLEREGAEVTLVPTGPDGVVDPAAVEAALTGDTVLVSIMLVNNELGTINDIQAVGTTCRDRGVLMHCDACQGAGRMSIDLSALCVDALSVCAHKMHGPQGVGALVLQGSARDRPIESMIEGGGHERGLRSGTANVAGIVGFGAAANCSADGLDDESDRVAHLRDRLEKGVCAAVPGAHVHCAAQRRVAHITSVAMPIAGTDAPVVRLDALGVACASGAACSSASGEPSHVLQAIGTAPEVAAATVRFSLGRATGEGDIQRALEAVSTLA